MTAVKVRMEFRVVRGPTANKPLQQTNAIRFRPKVGSCRDAAGCARAPRGRVTLEGDLAFAAERQVVGQTVEMTMLEQAAVWVANPALNLPGLSARRLAPRRYPDMLGIAAKPPA